MSLLIVTDASPAPRDISLSHGAAQQAHDARISQVLNGWWEMQADGWVSKDAYNLNALITYWRKRPQDPEAQRLMEAISHIQHIRQALPNGLHDANTERVFHTLIQLVLRSRRDNFVTLKYDHVLEFADQLRQPVVIERFDRSFGEFSNDKAQDVLYQGRNSAGVTAHELFIPVIADALVANSEQGRKAGCAIVTHATMPGEHWANLRIPTLDEKGRARSVLFTHCYQTRGGDNSWMFNPKYAER